MKKITKVEYQKKNKDRVNIYLDDEFAFGLDLNTMIKYSLSINMELDDDFISEILITDNEKKAFNYAISILGRSPKSEKEIRDKLTEKGYEKETIDNIIHKLKINKYIDDENYSELFIRDKINISKYGKRKIQERLYQKGIDKEIIQDKLKDISNEDEIQRAMELAEKKLRTLTKEEPLKRKMKIYNYLLNKGFEYETIKKAVSNILKSDFEDDCY
jgi:regulatory protein